MNIIVSINSNYYKQLIVMLKSFVLYNKLNNLYLINIEPLSKDMYKQIELFVRRYNGKLHIINSKLPLITKGRFPPSSLARIIAPFILPDNIDRALYLDVDILITKSLKDFYNIEMTGKGLVGIPDMNLDNPDTYNMKSMGLKRPYRYINSGVILYDLNILKCKYSYEKIITTLKNYKSISSFVD